MLIIKGTGLKVGEVPASQAKTLASIKDIPEFLYKIEDVETVKTLSTPGAFLVKHRPIGALGYYVTVAYVILVTRTENGLHWSPLDFDLDKIKSDCQVLKGYSEGSLVTQQMNDTLTRLNFNFTISLEFPMPGPLKLVPRSLVQNTADGLMNFKVAATVESLYQKVLQDFQVGA